jgi:two-component system, chemotaxis family, protein-glutamate methylesterase/glutaminase
VSAVRAEPVDPPGGPLGIDAIAIGGSAGALTVLGNLLQVLPEGAPPVLVVLHLPEDRRSTVHEILGHRSRVAVKQAEDKEWAAAGTVYVAPPGYHLLVEREQSLALSRDELVNFSRPSIDVLFESAADVYRDRMAAVILSGASRDGADGLAAVRRAGGIAIAQRPDTAEAPLMPAAAIEDGAARWVLSPAQLADWLERLELGPLRSGVTRVG